MNINYIAIIIIIILVGLISNLFNIVLVKYIQRRNSPVERAISMINCSGYNVGNFAIPFKYETRRGNITEIYQLSRENSHCRRFL